MTQGKVIRGRQQVSLAQVGLNGRFELIFSRSVPQLFTIEEWLIHNRYYLLFLFPFPSPSLRVCLAKFVQIRLELIRRQFAKIFVFGLSSQLLKLPQTRVVRYAFANTFGSPSRSTPASLKWPSRQFATPTPTVQSKRLKCSNKVALSLVKCHSLSHSD